MNISSTSSVNNGVRMDQTLSSTQQRTLQNSESSNYAPIQNSAGFLANMIDQVKNTPDVRADLVDKFRQKIQLELYPPPDIINGLTELVGGKVDQLATAGGTQ